MAETLKLEIVTPEAKIYSEEVEMVTLPGSEGELGIYPNHVPLMTQVHAGEIIVSRGGTEASSGLSDDLRRGHGSFGVELEQQETFLVYVVGLK